ncbi:MAG: DUF5685 family protein [Lachnospiraceae bacterium]|nr:DUF5685 family protein [Lachnospiraceae bacterium]
MFGYVIVNKPEMKFREFELYQTYYCGFCQSLKKKYGFGGQLTLSYDMTFLILLLTSLYEPANHEDKCRCIAHPLEKHFTNTNEFTEYAADMNILLTYYKCKDDWEDERKLSRLGFSSLLKKAFKEVSAKYPRQADSIRDNMELLHACEKRQETDIDKSAGYFGSMMAEIFVCKEDGWQETLRGMGFFLGKFIYLMDAYDDLEKDEKKNNYNALLPLWKEADFDSYCEKILMMMMAECSKAFELLPIIQNVEILRNILYSGVWTRFELKRNERNKKPGENRNGSV